MNRSDRTRTRWRSLRVHRDHGLQHPGAADPTEFVALLDRVRSRPGHRLACETDHHLERRHPPDLAAPDHRLYRSVDAIAEQHPIVRMRQELASKRPCVEIALEGLDTEAVATYLSRQFVDHQRPADFASHLHTQTSGNPLLLLNTLANFEQRGWLSQRDGAWTCIVDLATLDATVPDGTREIFSSRLDRLPPARQDLLEAASAGGETFPPQVLAAALKRDCDDVESECARLERGALFLQEGSDVEWPDGSRGRRHHFRHALYRQVLTAREMPTRRYLLHQRIAARLESGHGEIAGQLSFHCEHAGDLSRAVDLVDVLFPERYARRATHEAEALTAHTVSLPKRPPASE